MKSRKFLLRAGAGVGLAAGAALAPLSQAADTNPDAMTEVLVTASKLQAVDIQAAAYNISAISGATLEKEGVDDLDDLAREIPGLSTIDNGANNKQIVIRGLAASAGTEQVSVYFDEIPTTGIGGTNVQQTDVRLYDVERIEVLRGPQGTLYGSGSEGGTIRYIMNKPKYDDFDASMDSSVGFRSQDGGERYTADAMVNLPIIADTLAVRAVGYYRHTDGFVKMPDLGLDGTDADTTSGGRLMGALNIANRATLSASAYYQNTDSDGVPWVLPDADERPGLVRIPFNDRLQMYNVTYEEPFSLGTLTATASAFDRHTFYTFDVSNFTPPQPSRINQPGQTDTYSSEVRFASKLTGPVQFVAGGFYQERHTNNGSYGAMINPTTGELPPAAQQQIFFDSLTVASFKNRALFGEVNYTPIDRLTLTAGMRYFQLEHDSQATAIVNFFGGALGAGPVLGSTVNKAIYKGEASYQLTDRALMYLTYSQGFREGGENSPALHGTFPLTYNPDYVDNYEVGWKTQWLDRQLTLNGAVYYMLWQDIQVSQYDSTGAFTYTSNAGRARLYGVELEGVARPQVLPGLTANFSMRYSEQELTQDNPNAAAGDLLAGLKGNTIPNSFPWQADAGLEQRLNFGEWHPFARFDATYTGKAHTRFSLDDPTDREWGNFVLCNLRVGLEEARWSAALYAKNLFDRRAFVNWDVQQVPGIPDLVLTTQPREIGLQFALNL